MYTNLPNKRESKRFVVLILGTRYIFCVSWPNSGHGPPTIIPSWEEINSISQKLTRENLGHLRLPSLPSLEDLSIFRFFERFRSLKERTRGAIHVAGRGVVLDSQGPVLISEPRSSVEFSNETGAMIHCSAQGSPLPRIDWLMGDESPVLPIPHIREMLVNGSMYFLPFGAETYRHDVHSAVYRCQASNSVGRVLGREITVKAGEYLYFFTSDRLTSFTFPLFLPSPRVVTFYFLFY